MVASNEQTQKERRDGKTPVRVFVSYARANDKERKELLCSLASLANRGIIAVDIDEGIESGKSWRQVIEGYLRDANIAILMVSRAFMGSDFITNTELPTLFRRKEEDGLVLLPVLLQPTFLDLEPRLKEIEFVNNLQKPLSEMTENEVHRFFAELTKRVHTEATRIQERRTQQAQIQQLPISADVLESLVKQYLVNLIQEHMKETTGEGAEIIPFPGPDDDPDPPPTTPASMLRPQTTPKLRLVGKHMRIYQFGKKPPSNLSDDYSGILDNTRGLAPLSTTPRVIDNPVDAAIDHGHSFIVITWDEADKPRPDNLLIIALDGLGRQLFACHIDTKTKTKTMIKGDKKMNMMQIFKESNIESNWLEGITTPPKPGANILDNYGNGIVGELTPTAQDMLRKLVPIPTNDTSVMVGHTDRLDMDDDLTIHVVADGRSGKSYEGRSALTSWAAIFDALNTSPKPDGNGMGLIRIDLVKLVAVTVVSTHDETDDNGDGDILTELECNDPGGTTDTMLTTSETIPHRITVKDGTSKTSDINTWFEDLYDALLYQYLITDEDNLDDYAVKAGTGKPLPSGRATTEEIRIRLAFLSNQVGYTDWKEQNKEAKYLEQPTQTEETFAWNPFDPKEMKENQIHAWAPLDNYAGGGTKQTTQFNM